MYAFLSFSLQEAKTLIIIYQEKVGLYSSDKANRKRNDHYFMKIAICDDEIIFREKLRAYIEGYYKSLDVL